MSNLDAQTRGLIIAYLNREVGLDEVRRRLMRLAWDLTEESQLRDPVTARTALYLAEFARGHREVDELDGLLMDLVRVAQVTYAEPAEWRITGTSSSSALPSAPFPRLVGVGTEA